MSRDRRTTRQNLASGLAAILAIAVAVPALAPSARAQSVGARASGSVVILTPGGSGIAYDVLTDTLSGVFLAGAQGEPVSLLLTGKRKRGAIANLIPQDVMVLSTGSYQLDLPQQGGAGTVPQLPDAPPGELLFLAQFN
jgi:hypothetical protein